MIYAQNRIYRGGWDVQISLEFSDTNRSQNPSQKTRPSDNKKKKTKKRTYRRKNFAVLADHRVKIKENKRKDKYLDLAREVNKLLSMKLTVIPIGALGTVPKGGLKSRKSEDEQRLSKLQHDII